MGDSRAFVNATGSLWHSGWRRATFHRSEVSYDTIACVSEAQSTHNQW